jgi:hypothetical protein
MAAWAKNSPHTSHATNASASAHSHAGSAPAWKAAATAPAHATHSDSSRRGSQAAAKRNNGHVQVACRRSWGCGGGMQHSARQAACTRAAIVWGSQPARGPCFPPGLPGAWRPRFSRHSSDCPTDPNLPQIGHKFPQIRPKSRTAVPSHPTCWQSVVRGTGGARTARVARVRQRAQEKVRAGHLRATPARARQRAPRAGVPRVRARMRARCAKSVARGGSGAREPSRGGCRLLPAPARAAATRAQLRAPRGSARPA